MKGRWRLLWALCICLISLFASAEAAQADELEVHFLNVGRNDGILIRCGGEDVFIDSGLYKYGPVCRDYLAGMGVDDLKYYIGTHAHRDHVAGGLVILDAFDTGAVLVPHDTVKKLMLSCVETESERQALNAATFVNIRPGDQFTVGGATITCLGPRTIREAHYNDTAENRHSLVLMLTYGEVDILLTADATAESLRAIEAANPGCLQADVLKNPHHDGATRADILRAIRPAYTIISTDDRHTPVSSFTKELINLGSQVFSTAPKHCGNIVLTTDGQEISFKTQFRAESLALNETAIELYEGKKAKLNAILRPSKRYKAISFTSDNPAVAVVDADGKVTGVAVTDHKETVSVAEKALGDSFLRRYAGKSGTIRYSGYNSVDAVTGATATSRAVTDGVNRALAIVADLGEEYLLEFEENETD